MDAWRAQSHDNSPSGLWQVELTKGNNPKIMQARVVDLVHYTSPQCVYSYMKFHVHSYHTFKYMLWTKSNALNHQRAITQKLCKQEFWFFCSDLLLHGIYSYMKFHVDSYHTFKDMLQTNSRSLKWERAINSKLCKQELWFFCTALLNEIHPPMKF